MQRAQIEAAKPWFVPRILQAGPDQRTEMQMKSHSTASRLSDIFSFHWMEFYVSCFTYIISINLFAGLQCVEKELARKSHVSEESTIAVPLA